VSDKQRNGTEILIHMWWHFVKYGTYVVAFREVWDICGGISWSMGHV